MGGLAVAERAAAGLWLANWRFGVSGAEHVFARMKVPKEAVLACVVVAVTFTVTYGSTVAVKPLFAPDSRYYAAMALWYGGESRGEAARMVAEFSAKWGWASPDATVLFGWGLVQPRVVLPALSVPFVKLWGIDGLMVIPGLALAGVMALLAWSLVRRYGPLAGISTIVLIMCSAQIMFYGSAMLTESLSALWGALTLLAAWRYQRHRSLWAVALMVALTVISAFTRQSTFIVAGAFVAAWCAALLMRHRPDKWAVPAISVALTSVTMQVIQSVVFPTFSQLNQFYYKTGADSLVGALVAAPRLAWNIVSTDVGFFARSDRALMVLIALSILSGVVFWRRAETHLLIGAVAGSALYGITNGTPTAFRYAMPGLVFFAVSVALLMSSLSPRVWHGRRSDPTTERLDRQSLPGKDQPEGPDRPAPTAQRSSDPGSPRDGVHERAREPRRPTDAAARS